MLAMRRLAACLLAVYAFSAVVTAASDIEGSGRQLLQSSSSRPGPFTDWVVPECQQRCPNLFLASWGLQCALGSDQCCARLDTLCTPLGAWATEAAPSSWLGRDLVNGTAPMPPPPPPSPPPVACTGGGKWMNASVSQYESYPLCCIDKTVDQTECVVYSGCKYVGMFAAYGDTVKSLSWVKSHNIAAYFQPPNKQNMKEWNKKWKGKKLRIRNPLTCKTMIVKVLDTCNDRDCPDPRDSSAPGCCTRHANMNGGRLVDLEYHTSVRFWGAPIGVDEVRRLEFQLA